MMKRKAAARLRAAPVPPFRVNGWGDFFICFKQLLPFTESHHHAFMVGISGKLSVRHSRSASRSLLDLLASLARLFASSPTGRAQTLASHKRLCRLRESALHFVTIS